MGEGVRMTGKREDWEKGRGGDCITRTWYPAVIWSEQEQMKENGHVYRSVTSTLHLSAELFDRTAVGVRGNLIPRRDVSTGEPCVCVGKFMDSAVACQGVESYREYLKKKQTVRIKFVRDQRISEDYLRI